MQPCRLKPAFRSCLLAAALSVLTYWPAAGAGDAMTTVRPEDTGAALVNPDMGWTMHFYSNIPQNYGSKLDPADTLDDFPGLSTVYLRVPWAFLEPEEGRFNWALLDTWPSLTSGPTVCGAKATR